MALYRPVTQPQVIVAGLALFLTGAQGPTIPQGNPATPQLQAIAAYRGASRLTAQPAPANVAATALAVTTGPTIPQGALTSLASGHAVIAYRESSRLTAQPAPTNAADTALVVSTGQAVPPGRSETSATGQAIAAYRDAARLVQPPPAQAIPSTPPVLVFNPLPSVPAPMPWPYASMQSEPWYGSVSLVPSLGTQIPPSPVLQWLTQPPWPYVAAVPAPLSAAVYALVVTYTWSPTLVPVRQPEWPYAATRMREVSASQFSASTAYTWPLGSIQVPVREPEWPYANTMMPAPTASRWGVAATGQTVSIVQPYITVYFWKRTA